MNQNIAHLINRYAWIFPIVLQEPMGHNNTMAFYFGHYGPCCFVVWFESLSWLGWFGHDNKVLLTFKEIWKDIFSNKAHWDCCIVQCNAMIKFPNVFHMKWESHMCYIHRMAHKLTHTLVHRSPIALTKSTTLLGTRNLDSFSLPWWHPCAQHSKS